MILSEANPSLRCLHTKRAVSNLPLKGGGLQRQQHSYQMAGLFGSLELVRDRLFWMELGHTLIPVSAEPSAAKPVPYGLLFKILSLAKTCKPLKVDLWIEIDLNYIDLEIIHGIFGASTRNHVLCYFNIFLCC